MRISIRNAAPCARVDLAIVLSFVGLGRSPEQDAQPFLRVAEGGLGNVVAGRNPAGFVRTAPTLPFTV